MDSIDRKLLNTLQEGLPLKKDPYGIIADELGIDHSEVLDRIKALISAGYIRRLGGTFNTRAMGYESVLVGAHVPETIFHEVALHINAFSGVTHNYRRSSFLNMWFSLSILKEEEKPLLLNSLKEKFALTDVFEFPNLKSFKLRVFFDMESR